MGKEGYIYFYKHNFGASLNKWDRFTNWLWFHAGEQDELWAKMIHYPLQWLEQRKFDFICLIGKHFPDDENECERCYKKL